MRTSSQTSRLTGIVPPLVTPLIDPETLDLEGLERLIAHLIAGGVSGLFLLGTTGEGPSLGYALRRDLVRHAVRLANRRVPVLVAITDTALPEALAMAHAAADAGADAVVLAPPPYFPIGSADLVDYLATLLPRLPLPVMLYNMPSHCKVVFDVAALNYAVQSDRVIGMKDSSGDMHYFHRLLRVAEQRPDWSILMGPEMLLGEALLAGGHGGVAAGANIFPHVYAELCTAGLRQDLPALARLQRAVMDIDRCLYTNVDGASTSVIKGAKAALATLGICREVFAEPLHPCRLEVRERIRRDMAGTLLPLQRPAVAGVR